MKKYLKGILIKALDVGTKVCTQNMPSFYILGACLATLVSICFNLKSETKGT